MVLFATEKRKIKTALLDIPTTEIGVYHSNILALSFFFQKGYLEETFSWVEGSCFKIDFMEMIAWTNIAFSSSIWYEPLTNGSAHQNTFHESSLDYRTIWHSKKRANTLTRKYKGQKPFQAGTSQNCNSFCNEPNHSNCICNKPPMGISNVILLTHENSFVMLNGLHLCTDDKYKLTKVLPEILQKWREQKTRWQWWTIFRALLFWSGRSLSWIWRNPHKRSRIMKAPPWQKLVYYIAPVQILSYPTLLTSKNTPF